MMRLHLRSLRWTYLTVPLALLSIVSSFTVIDSINQSYREIELARQAADRLDAVQRAVLTLEKGLAESNYPGSDYVLGEYLAALSALPRHGRMAEELAEWARRIDGFVQAALKDKGSASAGIGLSAAVNAEIEGASRTAARHERDLEAGVAIHWKYLQLLAAVFCMLAIFPVIVLRMYRRDLLVQQAAQAALQESEERYRRLVERSPDAVALECGGKLVFANPAAAELFGTSGGQPLEGLSFASFVDLPARDQVRDAFHRVMAGEDVKPMACAIRSLDGRSVEVEIVSILSTYRNQPATQIIVRNVTERKLADRALAASEFRYRILFESVPDGVYQTSADGKVLAANPALVRLLGYDSEEDLKALDVARDLYVQPEARARCLERLEREGLVRNLELVLKRRDGGVVTVLEHSHPVRDEKGQVLYFEGTLTDISDLKRTEAELLRYTRELEAARERLEEQSAQLMLQSRELIQARDAALEVSRLKGEFLANVSHEIRTPMNGILGMNSLLLDTPLNAEQFEYAEAVSRSAGYLLNIINDILDFSKIEAGRFTLERIDFRLRETVELVVEMLAGEAAGKGLELASYIDPDTPEQVLGDPARLRQVLINLVGNAIKFTLRGHVILRGGLVRNGTQPMLRFEVSDTGIGIPENARARIFQPFSQADGSTARRFGGTGLGLAISRHLVERMGGAIGVESEPGEGSTFWFSFPVPEPAAAPPAPRFLGRVLIAEDSAPIRRLLRLQLEHWGLDVDDVSSCAEAIDRIQRTVYDDPPYELLLVDLDLNGEDGGQVVEALQAVACGPPPRVILMFPLGHSRPRPAPGGVISACIAKPVREPRLRSAVAAALGAPEIVSECLRQASERTFEPSPPAVPSGRRVLVAEDNKVNQRLALRLLEKLGYSADLASDGYEVLAAMARRTYDLVLMDCQMPGMDGFEATIEVRNLEGQGPRTPIVAMTAHTLTGDRERCLDAGMDDYLAKPICAADLARMLDRWITSGTPATAVR